MQSPILNYFVPVLNKRGASAPPPPPPFMAIWEVPVRTVGNDFTARIHFNYAVTGFNRNDLQLRQGSTVTTLTGTRATLMRETGNTYLLLVTLSGTLDDDYILRLRANRIEVDGENQPSAHIDSETFHITTGTLPPNQKAASRNTKVAMRNQRVPVRIS